MESDGGPSRDELFDPLEFFSNIPEIVEKIFSLLSVPDLHKCGQVSRLWRQQVATSFSTRKCYAYVTRNCKQIVKLSCLLPTLDSCLINSVKIQVPSGHSKKCKFSPSTTQAKAVRDNSMALMLRSLDVHVGVCPAANSLIKQMLLGASGTLEEITLSYCENAVVGGVTYGVSKTFDKLTAINVPKRFGWPPVDALNLMQLAPNLRTVNALFQIEDVEPSKCSRLELLTALYIVPYRMEGVLKPVLRAQPKLTELHICDITSRAIPQSWLTDLCKLLQMWLYTLKRLYICALTFLKLQQRQVLVLQTLDFLELFFPEDSSHEQFVNIIAGLNLQASCPTLNSLRIMFDHAFCSHEFSSNLPASAQFFEPALSVREVTTEKAVCMPAMMGTCISLFPSLSSFSFECLQCTESCQRTDYEHLYEVYRVWTEIPTLRRLKICVVDYDVSPARYSLDALFCGISFSEARELKYCYRRRHLDLHKYHYCPMRPSLSYAEKLEEITIILSARYDYKTFCVSEVAGYLVFARNTHLRLIIESHCSDVVSPSDLFNMAQLGKMTTTL